MSDYIQSANFNGDSSLATKPFIATATISAGAAVATPVNILADTEVPAGRKVYITSFRATVNGATAWTAGTSGTVFTKLTLSDTNGTVIPFADILLAALTANAVIHATTSNVTLKDAYLLNTGGTAAKGLQIAGNSAATTPGVGSDVVVTVSGFIK